jgi:hypothetical protein
MQILALRHQLGVLKRSVKRLRLTNVERGLWVLLSRRWADWSDALIIVKPTTVGGFWRIHVTSNFSATWTANQVVRAFPWESTPRYLLRDRDGIYGAIFRRRLRNPGIKEVMIAQRSPGQNPYAKRLIGTLRRGLLDHVIVLNEAHLRRLLRRYLAEHYHPCRTHLSLGQDSPGPKSVAPPDRGDVVELPLVGGLHLHTRPAASASCGGRDRGSSAPGNRDRRTDAAT